MNSAVLDEPPTRTPTSDFAALSSRMNAAGLLRRRPVYYAIKITAMVGLFVAGWVAFAVVGASWWILAIAVLLAFASTQVAFLGHDFGHRQVFRTRRPSELAGFLVGNLGVGMSYGWWMSKHSRHHANPNHEDHDPDVGAGALVWTPEQARERRGVGAWIARRQAYLFFPMLFLEGLNLHVASVREIVQKPLRHRAWEAALITAHFALYLGIVFSVLPFGMGVAFIAVHQGLFGLYMGMSFAPNHKGMPIITDDDDLDFLRKQVLTSRNVTGPRYVDFLLGGLNYQIEHHLFPNMPRANLRRAQPIARDFCRERGISYTESGAVASYAQGLAYLHETGQNAPKGR
jgi:fatty acid desaturase